MTNNKHLLVLEGRHISSGPTTIFVNDSRQTTNMLTQNGSRYTPTDQKTWNTLFTRQIKAVQSHAYARFLPGLNALDFKKQRIPELQQINQRLAGITGWSVYPVDGLIDNRYFFEQMFKKEFGATVWIRQPEQLDYLEEPDMFHDIFGHIPLLADPLIADYLLGLASIANRHLESDAVIEAIARLYWYTIEFGLVCEKDQLKIYGAGILSSIAETQYALSKAPRHEVFDIATIINTPYIKDKFQEQYFVLRSMTQLTDALPEVEKICRKL